MLAGVKFIPRDQVDKDKDEKGRRKSNGSKDKNKRRRKKKQQYSSSDDDLERIKKRSKKKQKWYSSEESSSYSSESEISSDEGSRRRSRGRKKGKRARDRSDDEAKTKSRGRRKCGSSEYGSSDEGDGASMKDTEFVRKEMGLEWMLRPQEKNDMRPPSTNDDPAEEAPAEELKVNPRELNPYLRSSGSGYPDDIDGAKNSDNELLSSSVVGDGGASWRLKALKRAQEQAAREGRKLDEVVEERWGSLGQLTVSAASRTAAPPHAHLHAIKHRKKEPTPAEEQKTIENETERDISNIEKNTGKDYLRGISSRHPEMKAPKVQGGLSWGRKRSQYVSSKDAGVISAAASSMNKFTDDGNFMQQFLHKKSDDPGASVGSSLQDERNADSKLLIPENNKREENTSIAEGLSANQLAAKALQLRLKGKHDEAEKLMKEAENLRAKKGAVDDSVRPRNHGNTSRYVMQDASHQLKKREDDGDMHLAHKIVQNKKYSVSGQADEEYDFDEGPRKKSRNKGGRDENKPTQNIAKRLMTQQERCIFCFENQDRPKHLVVSIANFTYLMLPKWQPVVPGHCCILTMQHESATRNVDNNVWEEIRNFKKCLIMMFAKQEKEMIFLETVMGLSQQRRHCLIECIPLPQEIAKQAPLYFKKAIDEAEDEWSQHNAKRLIDTSEKGLRGSIPKNFPYFHVEFGLSRGFVHVIDDEKQFKSSLGLNVIRGMLQLPEEDMHRRRKYDSVEVQRQAVVDFAKEWKHFDWTKQLD